VAFWQQKVNAKC